MYSINPPVGQSYRALSGLLGHEGCSLEGEMGLLKEWEFDIIVDLLYIVEVRFW
jgi:hypothetical protein